MQALGAPDAKNVMIERKILDKRKRHMVSSLHGIVVLY
jgi:hypothetical protein